MRTMENREVGTMINISAYIPSAHKEVIAKYTKKGIYASLCEFIRVAVKNQINSELKNYKMLKAIIESKDPTKITVRNEDGTTITYKRVRKLVK